MSQRSLLFLLSPSLSPFCPLLSLPLSLSPSAGQRDLSLWSIRVRSAYLRVHPSGFQIFGYSRCSLTIPYLCHCRSWDLEVGQPNHRRSVFLEARKKKKKKDRRRKRKRKKVNRKEREREREENWIRPSNARLERQSYFTNARTSFTLPLMD